MRRSGLHVLSLLLLVPAGTFFSSESLAVGQCKFEYGFRAGNTPRKVIKYINSGTTVTLNKNNMTYVKNLRQKKVKFFLSGFGVADVTLGNNQVNPAAGFYLTQTKLDKAQCLSDSQSSAPQPPAPSTPLALAQALKAAGKTASYITSQMKSTFNATASQVGSALKAAGFNANQIASAVKSAFNNSAAKVGQALKAAGFSKNQTIGALRTAFNSSASKMAEGLKAAGYPLNDIAGVLKSTLDLTRKQAETALRQAGYNITQIKRALDRLYGQAARAVRKQVDAQRTAKPRAMPSSPRASTPLALAQALKAAGKSANYIASQMKSTFKATAIQVARALKAAGFNANQIASAVKSTFNNSATKVGQALKAAGFSKNQIIGALRTAFNSSASKVAEGLKAAGYSLNEIASVLKNTLDLTRKQAETALRQAGYTLAQIKRVLDQLYRQAARAVRKQVDTQRTANSRAMASSMKIGSVLHNNRFNINGVQCSPPSGSQYGASGFPVPLPNNMRGPITVTIQGSNLMSATSISGLPAGVKASIIGRGNCGIRVSISVPGSVRFGATGIAVLKAGRQNSAARFYYSIRPIPRSSSDKRTYMELFSPRTTNRATGNRTTGNTSTADLRPTQLAVNLYKIGSATTADGAGNTYTALRPFNNSAFCQGIQEGGMLTTETSYSTQPGTYCVIWHQRATGAMTTDTTASCVGVVDELGTTTQVARRVSITVPDIVWGVENSSNTDVSDTFTIQLKRGGTVVATQTINSLASGQVSTFSYARPQSETTVAKVGPGAGCYHTGLSSAGWNDNQGYSVHVDTGNDVSESRENNNVRQL